MNIKTVSRIEAHRRIISAPIVQNVMITSIRRPFLYRLMDWIIMIMFGLFIGGACALLFIGCDSPSAPSRIPVHRIPAVVPQP